MLPNAEYDFGRLLLGPGTDCCGGADEDDDEVDDVEEDVEDDEAEREFDEAGLDLSRPSLAPPDWYPPLVEDWAPSLREDDDPYSLLSGAELDDD